MGKSVLRELFEFAVKITNENIIHPSIARLCNSKFGIKMIDKYPKLTDWYNTNHIFLHNKEDILVHKSDASILLVVNGKITSKYPIQEKEWTHDIYIVGESSGLAQTIEAALPNVQAICYGPKKDTERNYYAL